MTNRKHKILFLASWYPNRLKPALGNFVLRHAESVAAHDQVTALFVCPDALAPGSTFKPVVSDENGVMSVVVYYKRAALPGIGQVFRYLRAHLRGYRIIRAHLDGHPDIVHLNVMLPAGLFALYLNIRYRLPVMITEHSTMFQTGLAWWQKLLVRVIAGRAKLLCPVSDNLGTAMATAGIRTPRETVPNVVNTDLFRPERERPAGKKRILHVSTLNEKQKNISGILHVIRRLAVERNDFELHLVSELDPDHVIRMAEQMGLYGKNVFVHRFMPIDQVALHMRKASLFLLFSRYENLPCVILESMASGVPVVSTDVGGIREHLLPPFGALVSSEDEDALLQTLRSILDHPGRYDAEEMRTYAVSNFSREAVGRRFHELYSRLYPLPG